MYVLDSPPKLWWYCLRLSPLVFGRDFYARSSPKTEIKDDFEREGPSTLMTPLRVLTLLLLHNELHDYNAEGLTGSASQACPTKVYREHLRGQATDDMAA